MARRAIARQFGLAGFAFLEMYLDAGGILGGQFSLHEAYKLISGYRAAQSLISRLFLSALRAPQPRTW